MYLIYIFCFQFALMGGIMFSFWLTWKSETTSRTFKIIILSSSTSLTCYIRRCSRCEPGAVQIGPECHQAFTTICKGPPTILQFLWEIWAVDLNIIVLLLDPVNNSSEHHRHAFLYYCLPMYPVSVLTKSSGIHTLPSQLNKKNQLSHLKFFLDQIFGQLMSHLVNILQRTSRRKTIHLVRYYYCLFTGKCTTCVFHT